MLLSFWISNILPSPLHATQVSLIGFPKVKYPELNTASPFIAPTFSPLSVKIILLSSYISSISSSIKDFSYATSLMSLSDIISLPSSSTILFANIRSLSIFLSSIHILPLHSATLDKYLIISFIASSLTLFI